MKKLILVAFAFTLSSISAMAQQGNVIVNINDIEAVNGPIVVLLYKTQEGFASDPKKSFKAKRIVQYNKDATCTFTQVPYGDYAVTFFKDENNNGRLDTNFIGIPKEPVGASNMTNSGKPSFKKCKFSLKEQEKVLKLAFVL
jgi:uncharacterized protein (DUF2141 family)